MNTVVLHEPSRSCPQEREAVPLIEVGLLFADRNIDVWKGGLSSLTIPPLFPGETCENSNLQ